MQITDNWLISAVGVFRTGVMVPETLQLQPNKQHLKILFYIIYLSLFKESDLLEGANE